jgi:Holliday junction DNA helicase RuvA
LFRQLISVSGVGPNTAQMILSSLSPHEIQQAILSNNVTTLQSVKGIGGKTAQRIILDLKDKVIKLDLGNSSTISHNTVKDEALSALTMLGFNKNSIEKVIDKELQGASDLGVEEVVKRVLKKM